MLAIERLREHWWREWPLTVPGEERRVMFEIGRRLGVFNGGYWWWPETKEN